MVLQDFTDDWVEFDTDTVLTVTATKIAVADADFDNDEYVYKDYTAGFFNGDFTHQLELTVNTCDYPHGVIWAISDATTGYDGFAADDILLGSYDSVVAGFRLYLMRKDYAEYDLSNDLDFGTKYYVTVNRTGTLYTVTIRTGSHTGTVIDTITLDDSTTISRRYLYIYAEAYL